MVSPLRATQVFYATDYEHLSPKIVIPRNDQRSHTCIEITTMKINFNEIIDVILLKTVSTVCDE